LQKPADAVYNIGKKYCTQGELIMDNNPQKNSVSDGPSANLPLQDRKRLAQEGMIVVAVTVSGEDGSLISGPDIITRGFIYIEESEAVQLELKAIVLEALQHYAAGTAFESAVKSVLSDYLYRRTNRKPEILTVIKET
jgi:ribonuclease J